MRAPGAGEGHAAVPFVSGPFGRDTHTGGPGQPEGAIAGPVGLPARILVAMLIFSVAVSLLQPVWERYVDDDDEDASTPKKEQLLSGTYKTVLAGMLIVLQSTVTPGTTRKNRQPS